MYKYLLLIFILLPKAANAQYGKGFDVFVMPQQNDAGFFTNLKAGFMPIQFLSLGGFYGFPMEERGMNLEHTFGPIVEAPVNLGFLALVSRVSYGFNGFGLSYGMDARLRLDPIYEAGFGVSYTNNQPTLNLTLGIRVFEEREKKPKENFKSSFSRITKKAWLNCDFPARTSNRKRPRKETNQDENLKRLGCN